MATRSLGVLTLDLIAKIGGFETGMDKAARNSEKNMKRIEAAGKQMQRTIAGAFAAIGGASFISSIVRNTVNAENELAQLDAALRSTGEAAGFTRGQLMQMSTDFAAATTHSSGEIIEAQTRLLTYSSIVGDQFPKALQVAIDQSSRLGISLTQSAEIVGRALEAPSRGVASLTQQGFSFTKAQRELLKSLEETGRLAEAQQIVIDALNESYGGAGRAARDTFGGALGAIKNALTDLLTGSDGIPEVTSALNDMADQLRSPEFVQFSRSFFSGLIAGAIAAKSALVSLGTAIGGLAAAGRVLLNDMGWMDWTIPAKGLRTLAKNAGAAADVLSESFGDARTSMTNDIESIANLWRSLDQTLSQGPAASPVGIMASPSGQPEREPSEAFTKLRDRLEEQVALYGQVGEAAKVAYQIQIGGLDSLTKAEQQQVLSLARRYDGMVAAAQAAKELEAEQRKLTQSFESQVANYERELTLHNALGEAERIRYEFLRGELQGLNDLQKERLLGLAREVDLMRQVDEAIAEFAQQNMEALEESLGRAFKDFEKSALGAKDALTIFQEQAARNTQDIIADALTDGFDNGFKGILDSFADMITKMAAQAIAADIAGKMFGESGGGSGSGWVGSAIDWIGGAFGGARAFGGPVSPGLTYRVNELEPEFFVPNDVGRVIPLSKMPGQGRSSSTVIQNISVSGRLDSRTTRQIQLEAAREQRMAVTRLA